MRSFRSFVLSAVIAFSVIAASIQPARAVLPVWVGAIAYDTLVATASSVSIGVLARGFAANDPYVKTVATIPRATLASNMSRYLRGPRWAGLAALLAAFAALGWDYDEDIGLYTVQTDWPKSGFCHSFGSMISLDACGELSFQKNWGGCYVNGVFSYSRCMVAPSSTHFNVTSLGEGLTAGSCVGVSSPCRVYRIDTSGVFGSYYYTNESTTNTKLPVPASEIEAKGLPQLAASPNSLGYMFAGANPEMINKLLDGATIPYEATKPSPQLAELMSQYREGLLQSSDPNKPYYVDPDMMAKIQALVAKEDALNTDDGKLDALNKSIEQPITQAQYEASNQKYADAVNSVTDSVSSKNDFSDIDDHFKKLDDFVTDIPNTSLPSAASVTFPQYSSCRQLSLTDGKGHELVFPNESQCAKLEDVKQGFGYFLYLLCAFGLVLQLLIRPTGG